MFMMVHKNEKIEPGVMSSHTDLSAARPSNTPGSTFRVPDLQNIVKDY